MMVRGVASSEGGVSGLNDWGGEWCVVRVVTVCSVCWGVVRSGSQRCVGVAWICGSDLVGVSVAVRDWVCDGGLDGVR